MGEINPIIVPKLTDYITPLSDDQLALINRVLKKSNTSDIDSNFSLIELCDEAIKFSKNKKYNPIALNKFYDHIGNYLINQYYTYAIFQMLYITRDENIQNNIFKYFPELETVEFKYLPEQERVAIITQKILDMKENHSLLNSYINKLHLYVLHIANFIKMTEKFNSMPKSKSASASESEYTPPPAPPAQ